MINAILIGLASSIISLFAVFSIPANLIILSIIFLSFIILFWKNPFYGFLFILLIFWVSFSLSEYTRIPFYNFNFDIQYFIILISSAAFIFVTYNNKLSAVLANNKFVISIFVCFLVTLVVSTYFSPSPYSWDSKTLLLNANEILKNVSWLILFIGSLYMFQDIKNRQKFSQFISIFVICVSIIALVEYLAGYNFLLKYSPEWGMGMDDSVLIITRTSSVFNHPNNLGSFLAIFFPFLIFHSLYKKKLKQKILPIIALSFLPLALFTTFSRTSWIAAFSTVLLLFFFYFRSKKVYIILLLAFIGISAAFLLLDNSPLVKVKSRMQADAAVSNRIDIWKGLWGKSNDRKLLGYGSSSVDTYLSKQIIGSPMEAHNQYLKILVENGYPGLLAYITFFAVLIIKYFKKFIINKNPAGIFTLSIIISYLLMTLTTKAWDFRASFFFVALAFFDNVLSQYELNGISNVGQQA